MLNVSFSHMGKYWKNVIQMFSTGFAFNFEDNCI